MEKSSSSDLSNHYAVLIQTISELRSDLERTSLKLKSLQDENDQLRRVVEQSREESNAIQKKYKEARESYLSTATEKFEAEQQHEALIDRLKSQLQEKTKEFEKIRDDLIPHDIDQLRIKVQEELEIRHKQEIKSMEEELESQRERSFSVRRDAEKARVEYQSLLQNQQNEINSLRQEKEQLIDSLRSESVKNRYVDLTSSKDDKLRQQTSQLAELSHLVELLREEVKVARHEKDDLQSALTLSSQQGEAQHVLLKASLASLEGEKQALQQRLSNLEKQLGEKENDLQASKLFAEELSNRLENCQKEYESAQRMVQSLKIEISRQIESSQSTAQLIANEHAHQVQQLRSLLREREESLRQIQREASEVQMRAEGMERELRRSHLLQLQEVRKKAAIAEMELADATQNARSLQDQLLSQQEQLSFDKESLISEVSRIRKEKEILLTKLREADNNNEMLRKKQLASQQEESSKVAAAEKKARDAIARAVQLENSVTTLTTKNGDVERDRNQIRDRYDQLEHRYNQLLLQVDTMKADFLNHLRSVAPDVKERIDAMQSKMKSALAKERKRAEAYKAKALEAHYQIKALGESR